MNIINKLTIRHLKQNKRRTLVTILGTIISVAMITAVATLVISFMDLLERQQIADHGEWHVQYHDISSAEAAEIREDEATADLILSGDRGYAEFNESLNSYKPYVFIRELNDSGFENIPVTLQDGRLPESPDEIVVSEEIVAADDETYAIGEEIVLDVGTRVMLANEQEPERPLQQQDALLVEEEERQEELRDVSEEAYTIVGVIERPTWEPSWAPGYTMLTYTDESYMSEESDVNGLVVLDRVDRSLFGHANDVADAAGIERGMISFNNELLRFMGVSNNDNLQTTLYSLAAIIMAVIIFGSIALIYNAFAISVSERSRHLGMLASVGATKKQKRNSVFFEGAVIGLISIPIGIGAGLAGLGLTFAFVNRILNEALNVSVPLLVTVTPWMIVTVVLIAGLTIFISTYMPARKASKISAIDAIRQTSDMKLTEKAVRNSPLVRKLFGFEAEIGLKNMKRNKRKYQVTVFSLVVSIILFLSVSFFTESITKSLEMSQEDINYDIQVMLDGENQGEDFTGAVASLDEVTSASVVREAFFTAWIEEENISTFLQERVEETPELLQEGRYQYQVNVYGLNDGAMRTYAEEIGVEPGQLTDNSDAPAVLIDKAVHIVEVGSGLSDKRVEAAPIQTTTGSQIGLFHENVETGDQDPIRAVTVEAMTDTLPTGVSSGGGLGQLTLIVSEDVYDQLEAGVEHEFFSNSYMYLDSSDPAQTQEDIEAISNTHTYIYNVEQSRNEQGQLVMLMSVFTYGFITLITLISIANIFNTISTSISLRKREFAMLKSIGMTPKSFRKMINYESIFYGIKALLYGVPISIGIMYLIHLSVTNTFDYGFTLPWMSLLYVGLAVFAIVGAAMLYSISKIKKDNIIETLKQENI
ncbi:ABC transporter permease [Bacillus daqingensis]|uniref:ABC transporter permease n=1 Tax=Bacillus daqingensis TaxID=872396 RepID=A0ABV9NVE3_9BACI